jgi:hypothetical protein
MSTSRDEVIAVICTLLILWVAAVATQREPLDITRLSFAVTPVKTRVLPFETLEFVFTVRNRTGEVRRVEADFRPLILHPARGRALSDPQVLEADGTKWEVCETGTSLLMPPSLHVVTLAPGEAITRIRVLASENGEHKLARPGRYQFKGMIDKLVSETVEIVVREPDGIERAAYEYLQKFPLHRYFSEWTRPSSDLDGVEGLEQFISRFQGSQYADMAKLGLAQMWMKGVEGKKDLELAQSLLVEVTSSSDQARAARVNYYLGQIAEEGGELIDAQQYYNQALTMKADPYVEFVVKEAQAKLEPRLAKPQRKPPRR